MTKVAYFTYGLACIGASAMCFYWALYPSDLLHAGLLMETSLLLSIAAAWSFIQVEL